MQTQQLEHLINSWLKPELITDYCPNGLQVDCNKPINKVVTGVSATQALIDAAIEANADAILVHHGYFWKNETPTLVGMKYQRIQKLIKHNISLFAYHLPLDVHPEVGNNVQLAQLFNLNSISAIDGIKPQGVLMQAQTDKAIDLKTFAHVVEQSLQRKPLVVSGGDFLINKVAICTGGGQSFIEQAANAGADLFITGEVSEQTVHIAAEMGIHFIAAGHHATERYGIKALGEHLAQQTDIDVEFIDIYNPA
ncbi:NIF3 protein [Catenovulum agarivorans DS-2]|uniref:GTP cyclohydrolase 1 type 2 homolog n=1 Tax=Catenovulum agarivorans DS-2 TaxID=1328313 RepID=W7QXA0_9ALTE|nr:Nif3-like dinuclear metal center hexameric protein [Catenovulum agarivorans]EWH12358.1 NIF3 protein [Catenovulum agarivorans DS-2]